MNARRSKHLLSGTLSIFFALGLYLFLEGCNDRSTSNSSPEPHKEHGDHDGHDHGGHEGHGHDDHGSHEGGHHDDHSDSKQGHDGHDHGGHEGHGHDDHGSHEGGHHDDHSDSKQGHDGHDHGGHEGHGHDDHGSHEGGHHDDHSDSKQGHDGHGHDDHDSTLHIGHSEQRELGIDIATAGPDTLAIDISLPGELVLNPDNVAHVVPKVSGVTRSVHKRVGDSIQEGDLLAILDSRELAKAKAHFLATLSKERIARANLTREEKLWEEKISSERAFLDARQALEESQIAHTLADRDLHALGIPKDEIADLPNQPESQYTHYEITSPISGTVIERHLVRGEVVREDTKEPIFVIADLTSVWLNLTVYTTHLGQVHAGQKVLVTLPNRTKPLPATIEYVSPLIDESTRTATARVVLPNPDGTILPGLFVTAMLALNTITAPVLVPKTAIQTIEGRPTIFIQSDNGFIPITVILGASNQTHAEIRSGLEVGDSYVAQGGFVLKSEMMKSELEHAGHAH